MDKKTQKHILNILRQGTLTWHIRNEVLNRGRYQVTIGQLKKGGDRKIWMRKCDICDKAFALKDSLLQVDHISAILNFTGDWNKYIEKMYCPEENLQALCSPCHLLKTQKDIAPLRYERKNNNLHSEAPFNGIDFL
jgi:5-methylcytosine-specific restriction endonuclease McrA